MYSSKLVRGDYEPGFRMDLGLKDLRLAVAAGMGSKDWSAVAEYTLR